MVSRAEAKYLRISPFKARMVIRLVKGAGVKKAATVLETMNKKGAYLLRKVLKSAVANAKNKGYEEETLYISKVTANPGPVLKRFRAATFGRATPIRKRTSHILVELDSTQKLIENVKTKGKG
jgi:large subunit ribosomal protein L22